MISSRNSIFSSIFMVGLVKYRSRFGSEMNSSTFSMSAIVASRVLLDWASSARAEA